MQEKRWPLIAAMCMAASPGPTTGIDTASRAASSPGSPMQSMRTASIPSASACMAAIATWGAASVSSKALSMEAGPASRHTALNSRPRGRSGASSSSVIAVISAGASQSGVMTRIRTGVRTGAAVMAKCHPSGQPDRFIIRAQRPPVFGNRMRSPVFLVRIGGERIKKAAAASRLPRSGRMLECAMIARFVRSS